MLSRARARPAVALAAVFTVAALAACEDETLYYRTPDAGAAGAVSVGTMGGFSSVATGVGGGGGLPSIGTGIAGGMAAGGFSAAGGGATCAASGDFFAFDLQRFDGSHLGCGEMPPALGYAAFSGVATGSDGTFVTIDECAGQPPPCMAGTSTIAYAAQGLQYAVPQGAEVRVEAEVALSVSGCTQRLLVTDLVDGALYFAGADGTPEAFQDAPFSIAPIALGGCAGGIAAWALEFQLAIDPGSRVTLTQGQTVPWMVDVMPNTTTWLVHDLRSYRTGNPNDDGNWAYWLFDASAPPGG
ncbi:MAG TPA: hypothetical protein VHB21_20290 [Minicystis sp.]|nr:hypothetical protein [Minicystis sp.]